MSMSKFYLSQKTKNYLIQSYGLKAKLWIQDYDNYVEELVKKWNLNIHGYEESSRFGAIFYAFSVQFGEVVLKIIPVFSDRLKSEIQCYFELPYSSMCNIIDFDYSIGAILLEYVNAQGVPTIDQYISFLNELYVERRVRELNFIKVQEYWEIWEIAASIAEEKRLILSKEYNYKLSKCLDICFRYKKVLRNLPQYYIHGDVHEHNILGKDKLILIDPIGYIAPFEVEYARFVGTYFREHSVSEYELEHIIFSVLKCGRDESESIKFCLILGLDVTLRACNTFFEGNVLKEIEEAIDWACSVWSFVVKFLNL